jgi:AraC-like DNA-binding protein
MESTRPTRTACSEAPDRRWEMVVGKPASRLQPHVCEYEGWSEWTSGPTLRKQFGGVGVPMIFLFEEGFRSTGNPAMPLEARNAFIAGINDTYALTDSGPRMDGVQINLSPLAAYRMFGVPMHELSGHTVELEDVLGDDARVLGERLRDASDGTGGWNECFDVLDEYFAQRLATGRVPSEGVAWAWHQLVRYDGQVEIRNLADEIGWSAKRLIAEFREQIGMPPKAIARALRFRKTLRLYEQDPSRTWSEIALRSGYYDQAHFIRDFRQFSGGTPTEYVQQRFPDGGGVRA